MQWMEELVDQGRKNAQGECTGYANDNDHEDGDSDDHLANFRDDGDNVDSNKSNTQGPPLLYSHFCLFTFCDQNHLLYHLHHHLLKTEEEDDLDIDDKDEDINDN